MRHQTLYSCIIFILSVLFFISSVGVLAQNVGIGTNTPSNKLEINSSTPNTSGLRFTNLTSTSATVAANGKYLSVNATGDVILTPASSTGTSNNWSILGNSGTTAGTNFIGTTDNQDLIFKRNNSEIGRLANLNISFGSGCFTSNTTGQHNIALGDNALFSNTTGVDNTAIGFLALSGNTSGFSNNAIGQGALSSNSTGYVNNAIGYHSLFFNTIGNLNNGIGAYALRDNISGDYNNAVGDNALAYNTTGDQNNAIGKSTLYSNTSGKENNAIGSNALALNISGNGNIALGVSALDNCTIGNYNIGIGYNATLPIANADNQLNIANVIYGININNINTGSIGIRTSSPTSVLSVNGTADKVGGGAWGTFSDARVKKNVVDYTKGLKEILQIRPVSFQYNGKGAYAEDGKTYVGIIAQEIENILPSTVTKTKLGEFDDLRQYDSSELLYTLINAIKEQNQQIQQQQQQINAQEKTIQLLLKK